MGGYALTDAAASKPEVFSRLLLVDPVILPPALYAERASGPQDPSAHPTAKRRNHWENWEAMEARFADRLPFKRWEPAVLEDYCRYGVLPGSEGASCWPAPRRWKPPFTWGALGGISTSVSPRCACPSPCFGRRRARAPGRHGFQRLPTWPELASKFPQGRDVVLSEHSHFIPMEAPALTAAYILGER